MTARKTYAELRSARWMAPDDLRSFGHRSRTMQMGYGPEDWEGKPIIAVLNTWSEAQPCHMHFKDRVEWVKRGILQAGRHADGTAGAVAEREPGEASTRCSTATCWRWRPKSCCARIPSTARC